MGNSIPTSRPSDAYLGEGCPSVSFVTCIEAGPLELHVLRMLESFRRWGGRFRDCPLMVYQPRFGPPIGLRTRKLLDDLSVTYRQIRAKSEYNWNGFYNKPVALMAADEDATTEQVGFLDGDLLILGQPDELELANDEDFVACAPDKNCGTSGPGDPNHEYWGEIYRLFGFNEDDIPWITTAVNGERIRLYWNGGVFVYRRSTGFAREFLADCERMLRARFRSPTAGIFFIDQIALTMTMIRTELRWRALGWMHNFAIGSRSPVPDGSRYPIDSVKLLHLHDAMWPPYWPTLLDLLRESHPEVHGWLEPLGPASNTLSPHWKLLGRYLKSARRRRQHAYEAGCRVIRARPEVSATG